MTWTIGMISPATDRTVAHLLEKGFAERDILDQATRAAATVVSRDGAPNGWYAGDPEICAGCALAIEQAREYCLNEPHNCDPFCWDDVRCPNCRQVAP